MNEGIARPSHLVHFAQDPINITILLVAAIVALIVAVAIAAIWGIFTLLGVVLIMTSSAVILLNRGRSDTIFYIALVAGIFFIVLQLIGFELGTVDLSTWPFLKNIDEFIRP